MSKFCQFLQKENGQYSATRLAFLAWVFGALIVWSTGSLYERKMQDLPSSLQTLIGILMTGKVTQKFTEKKSRNILRDPSITDNCIKTDLDKDGNNFAIGSARQN
jgi:hypothetical protein